jgi:hypothetical protein
MRAALVPIELQNVDKKFIVELINQKGLPLNREKAFFVIVKSGCELSFSPTFALPDQLLNLCEGNDQCVNHE